LFLQVVDPLVRQRSQINLKVFAKGKNNCQRPFIYKCAKWLYMMQPFLQRTSKGNSKKKHLS